jgi:putative ATP-binding cassette transporter
VNNTRPTLATVWRIAAPYFRSEDKFAGLTLLATLIVVELALVAIDVLVNQWYNRFYNALQEKNWDTFVWELGVFTVLATINVALSVYDLYLNQWLQIRWRRWMTTHYLGEWLHDANHYRMQLKGDAADNPDQRITDDVKMFVESTLGITVGLLSSIVSLASFVVILWGLSATAPLHIFGKPFEIPGYLVWGALIYAVFGTALTHWIGSPLVHLDFSQQRLEADFRFNLVRVRENSEQIALLQGEVAERGRLSQRFGRVVDNWYAIMSRTKRLTAFTSSYSQAAVIFPFVLVTPAYFADKIQLGGLMQTASAFGSVQKALSFFVSIYRSLASTGSRRRSKAPRRRRQAPIQSMSFRRPVAMASIWSTFWSRFPTEHRWSRPTASTSRPMNARSSPVRPARASRPCSAPSRASGRSAAVRSRFPRRRP